MINYHVLWDTLYIQGVFFNSVIYESGIAQVNPLWITFIKQVRLSTHMDV